MRLISLLLPPLNRFKAILPRLQPWYLLRPSGPRTEARRLIGWILEMQVPQAAQQPDSGMLSSHTLRGDHELRAVIVDGRLDTDLSNLAGLPEGVYVGSIRDAPEEVVAMRLVGPVARFPSLRGCQAPPTCCQAHFLPKVASNMCQADRVRRPVRCPAWMRFL